MGKIFNLKTARFLYKILFQIGNKLFDIDSLDKSPDCRFFEYTFAIERLLNLKPGKILDIGCTSRSNYLPGAFVALGWQVYGIDTRQFDLVYPNFHFVQSDVTAMPFPDNYFDAVYAVSTLEHMGVAGRYKIKKNDSQVDFQAILEIKRVLKPNGKLIVTVPYGRLRVIGGWARIYDKERLNNLFRDWKMNYQGFFIRQLDGSGLIVNNQLDSDSDFERNEATILLEMLKIS